MTTSLPPTPPASAAAGPYLSLVVAVYFEEECITRFIEETTAALESEDYDYEIVFVDDGSTDRTTELVCEHVQRNSRLRLVELSYNHGKAFALTAGIEHARGRWILCMDPDLQDPPDFISAFVRKAEEGYDLVFGVREEKADSFVNVLFSRLFWWSLERFTGLELPRGLATMRIIGREFADRFLLYPEANRFVEGLFMHVGMRRTEIVIPHRQRFAGRSKFNFRRKVDLAVTAMCDFSDLPLRLTTRAGLVVTGAGFLGVFVLVVLKLLFIDFQLGWPSVMSTMIIGFGMNLFCIGIIGKYLGNVYREVKRRPLYSVRRLVNVETPR